MGFYGDLRKGFSESQLNVNYVNEIHGRVVLDFLNKLWKVKWLGLGGSYFWGEQFTGWSVGVDAAFKSQEDHVEWPASRQLRVF